MSAHTTDPAVLDALRTVHATDGRATIRSVAAASGVPFRTVYDSLERLRALGLADWDDELAGTLHPTWPTPPPPRLPDGTLDVREQCRRWDAHCNQGLAR